MNRFSCFLLILIVVALRCNQNKVGNLILTQDVWILNTDDYMHRGQKKTTELRFNLNGYAYEENTILKYEWQLNSIPKILEINGQEFDILQVSGDTIYLKNTKTGIEASLVRHSR